MIGPNPDPFDLSSSLSSSLPFSLSLSLSLSLSRSLSLFESLTAFRCVDLECCLGITESKRKHTNVHLITYMEPCSGFSALINGVATLTARLPLSFSRASRRVEILDILGLHTAIRQFARKLVGRGIYLYFSKARAREREGGREGRLWISIQVILHT